MKRSAVVLAILLLLQSSGVGRTSVSAKDNWLSVRSKNFLLVGNANEKQIRQVGMRLEQFREVFAQLFPKAVHTSAVPTTVIVFKNDDSYRPFKPNPGLAGYFQPGQDVNYITLTNEVHGEQDPFKVIFHEYTHLLINNTTPNVPLWFNEGLAEYYSTFSMTDDTKVVLGSPVSSHVFVLREARMLPLRTLFKVDEQSPYYNEGDKQSVFYAESWALMHYLILGKDGRRVPQMGEFLKLLSANVPPEEAFKQAFAMSFESMENELRAYIKHDRYPVLTGRFENKVVVESDMQAAPISEAAALAYLGDLLLHIHRGDSEAYLKQALLLDPNEPLANASLAMLLLKQGKAPEARKQLEKAAANSANYLLHYYYAYSLSRQGEDEEVVSTFSPETAGIMRAELKKAIALKPDFAESYTLFAFVNLVTGTNIDESIGLLKAFLERSPGKNNVKFMLAQLELHNGDIKSARPLLEQLSGIYNDAPTRQQAQKWLDQLKVSEEQLAHRRESNGTGSALLIEPTTDTPVIDPSSYLREALRKPRSDETQVQGILERIDCDPRGMEFTVRLEARVLKLRSASFHGIDLISFSPDAGREISCGQRKPESSVVVYYVANTDSRLKVDGTLHSLEFVPKDFQLQAAP
ncbi:MAG TPA: tetratricopeptide repeat protein [Pyrinomonadaceae bacterium]|nr:tetratricopeptide repeat protein [Pyrinomonadaceae bacterium]